MTDTSALTRIKASTQTYAVWQAKQVKLPVYTVDQMIQCEGRRYVVEQVEEDARGYVLYVRLPHGRKIHMGTHFHGCNLSITRLGW